MTDLIVPKSYRNFDDRWEWLVAFMVIEDPFVHEILMMMEKHETTAIPTMAVAPKDGKILLLYNRKFLEGMTDPEVRFVIKHEIYHVVLHHISRRKPIDEDAQVLHNLAADLAINSLIPDTAQCCMPTRPECKGVRPKDLQYNFEEKLSMEQYYQLLEEKFKGKGGGGKGKGKGGDGDPKGKGEDGDGDPGKNGFDDHGEWSEKDAEVIKEVIRQKIEQLAKRDHVWGNTAGDVKEMILAAQRSYVPWHRYLRHYFGNLISSRKESTFKKPNRRFGYPYSGSKYRHLDRKCVYWDASGSISDKDLAQFTAETNKLAEIMPVDMQIFDVGLQGPTTKWDKKRLQITVPGRGGTDFSAIMKHAEEQRYQSIIILTDGCAGAPERPQHVKDILWVIVGGGNPPVDWGTVIHITEEGVKEVGVTQIEKAA